MKSALLLTAFLAVSSVASADVLFSTGFEAPGYSTGALDGQNGWVQYGPIAGNVENTVAHSGTQAVQYVDGTGDQSLSIHQLADYDPSLNVVTIDIKFMDSGTTSGWDVLAVDDVVVKTDPNAGFIGQIVDDNGTLRLGLASTFADGGQTVTLNQWEDVSLVLDFNTQTQYAYLNSNLIGSGAFASVSTGLGDVAFGLNGAGGTDTGYFDDLSVIAVAAPEPSSVLLLMGGIGALISLRKKLKA